MPAQVGGDDRAEQQPAEAGRRVDRQHHVPEGDAARRHRRAGCARPRVQRAASVGRSLGRPLRRTAGRRSGVPGRARSSPTRRRSWPTRCRRRCCVVDRRGRRQRRTSTPAARARTAGGRRRSARRDRAVVVRASAIDGILRQLVGGDEHRAERAVGRFDAVVRGEQLARFDRVEQVVDGRARRRRPRAPWCPSSDAGSRPRSASRSACCGRRPTTRRASNVGERFVVGQHDRERAEFLVEPLEQRVDRRLRSLRG